MKRYIRNSHNFIAPVVLTTLITLIAAITSSAEFTYALLWLCTVLAFLLNTDQLFGPDYRSGLLEQYFFSDLPPYFIVLMKVAAFCLLNTSALLFINIPVIVFLTQPEAAKMGLFLLCFLTSVPSLAMLVALGASYALASFGGFIPALISFPFYVPLIILSMLALTEANPFYYISILAALTLLYVALLTLAIQFILKNLAAS